MPSCFVCGGSRTPLTKLQNITFHRFSADPNVRGKWYDFIRANGLDIGDITKHSLICSSHFDPSLFITNNSCRTLSKRAVPFITISRVKSAKAMYPEKKLCLPSIAPPILDMNKPLVKTSTSIIDSKRSITSDKDLQQLDVSMTSYINLSNHPTSYVENRSIQVSAKNIDCEGVLLLDDSVLSNSTSLNILVEDNVNPSFLADSSSIAVDDTPRRQCLKLGIHKFSKQMATKRKQLKTDPSMISPIPSTSRTMHNSFESIPEPDPLMISPIPSTSRTTPKHCLSPNNYSYSTPKKKTKEDLSYEHSPNMCLKKKKVYNTSRIGDLTSFDFGTPRRSSRNLKVVKKIVQNLRRKNKILIQKTRRLEKKLHN